MTSGKNILMIDRCPMTYRGIVLEARALSAMGHRVLLACTLDPTGVHTQEGDAALPTIRFLEYKNHPPHFTRQPMSAWSDYKESPESPEAPEAPEALEAKSTTQKNSAAKLVYEVNRLYALSDNPALARDTVRGSAYPNYVKFGGICLVFVMTIWRSVFSSSAKKEMKHASFDMVSHSFDPVAGSQSEGADALQNSVQTDENLLIPIDLQSENLRTYFVDNPPDLWESKVIKLALAISDLDVVHVHDLPALRAGVFIGRQLGIPVIYDAHELYAYQPNIVGERKSHCFEIESRLIHHCAEVVVINRQQAEIMREDYNYHRFTVLSNATVRPEGFDPARRYSLIRDVLPIPPQEKTMLFMGGINALRKIDELLVGMSMARKGVHMVFLTFGSEVPFYKNLAQELGIADRVHFLPPVPWDDIVYWCASADVGVMPYQLTCGNNRIGSPSKMYEFIAAATPMFGTSEIENIRNIVEGEHFGVVLPLREPKDYAAIIDLIFDENLGGCERFRPSLLARGDRYLWDRDAEDFIAMYQRIFAKNATSQAA
jgi:glycosyltransferase involved in cell wall biosynthesis